MRQYPYIVDITDHRGRPRRLVIRLDEDAVIPPYEQLRAQLSVMVAVGLLEPGTRLPTIRSLAASLELAPGTVARSYRELELEGVLVGRGRRGTFVSDNPPESEPLDERRRQLAEAAESYAFRVRQLGVPRAEAAEAAGAAIDSVYDRPLTADAESSTLAGHGDPTSPLPR